MSKMGWFGVVRGHSRSLEIAPPWRMDTNFCGTASEPQTVYKSKCLPILYYGMEACPLRESQFKSLDFDINSAMRKLFNTKSQDVVDACRDIFNCLPAESLIANRRRNFWGKISVSENKLCSIFVANAVKELFGYDKGSCSVILCVFCVIVTKM